MARMVGDWIERMGGGIFGAHKVFAEDGSVWLIKPIRHAFPDSTAPDLQWGMRGVVTEFVAGKLAAKFGIATPEHTKLYLYQATINAYPELKDFTEGYVLAIEWQDGYDLNFLEANPEMLEKIKYGINDISNKDTALAIIVSDTLLSNPDRYSWHIHGGRGVSGNKGNILFVKMKGSNDIYDVFAIDYGLSFNLCRWGEEIKSNWPREMFGMMKVFVRMGWVTGDAAIDGAGIEKWTVHINSFNLNDEIDLIVKELPAEWHINTLPSLEIKNSDFEDLKIRLNSHKKLLQSILKSQYAPSFATVKL